MFHRLGAYVGRRVNVATPVYFLRWVAPNLPRVPLDFRIGRSLSLNPESSIASAPLPLASVDPGESPAPEGGYVRCPGGPLRGPVYHSCVRFVKCPSYLRIKRPLCTFCPKGRLSHPRKPLPRKGFSMRGT